MSNIFVKVETSKINNKKRDNAQYIVIKGLQCSILWWNDACHSVPEFQDDKLYPERSDRFEQHKINILYLPY